MHSPRATPPLTDLADEVTNLSAGLGLLTFPFFPFALPALALVVVPLAVIAVAGMLLAAPLLLTLWLVRRVVRGRSGRRDSLVPSGSESRAVVAGPNAATR
jgi:membrane protein implicated in regulation of membrane protease activity